jgi:hypothetical protein
MTIRKGAFSFIASEASERARYAEGDHGHIEAVMALGGFGSRVNGQLIGPDGDAYRPGIPCQLHRPRKVQPLAPMRPTVSLPRAKPKRLMERRDTILNCLITGRKSSIELREALCIEPNAVQKALRRVVGDGLVEVVERGNGGGVPHTYAITELGRKRLASVAGAVS